MKLPDMMWRLSNQNTH